MDNANDQGGAPLDDNYDESNIAPETLAQMIADCTQFQQDNETTLILAELSDERAGHDFWLTRNGHGSGFWDEYYGPDKLIRNACLHLSDASKAYGSFDLYVGDDGKIYGS